jgi:hypothetical protein
MDTFTASVVLQLLGSWLLLVTGGGPTQDKPTVTFEAPGEPDRVSTQMIFRVDDCIGLHALLTARGRRRADRSPTRPRTMRCQTRASASPQAALCGPGTASCSCDQHLRVLQRAVGCASGETAERLGPRGPRRSAVELCG